MNIILLNLNTLKKMKINLLSLFVVLFIIVCTSCSGDEPKSGTNDNQSPTYTDDGDHTLKIYFLARKPWTGTYYFERHDSKRDRQRVYIQFVQGGDDFGTGTMTVSNNGKPEDYKLNFRLIGNKVVAKVSYDNSVSNDNVIEVIFEYRDGLLYMTSNNFAPIVLGRDWEIFSDARGIHKDQSRFVYKVWLHENGMNILDFRSGARRIFQLEAPGSDKYNYYDTFYGANAYTDECDCFDLYCPTENTIRFDGYASTHSWDIIEVTEEKMVLQGFRKGITDVFYAASKDILPKEIIRNENDEYYHGEFYYITAQWQIGG